MTRLIYLLALSASLLLAATASANVRAPIVSDGDVIIAKIAEEAAESVTLTHQKLVVTFPLQLEKEFTDLDANIRATYTFENTDDEPLTLPMVFLATGIKDPTVTINDADPSKPTTAEMNSAQHEELTKAAEKYAPLHRLGRAIEDEPLQVDGATATFELKLKPGPNVVTFSYTQNIRFNERGTRYGGPTHDHSETALTYLLYPCRDWKRSDDFTLDIDLIIPDYKHDGWLWDTHWAPNTTINLPLTPSYDKKTRHTTYTGQFHAYPDDVLHVEFERGKKR